MSIHVCWRNFVLLLFVLLHIPTSSTYMVLPSRYVLRSTTYMVLPSV